MKEELVIALFCRIDDLMRIHYQKRKRPNQEVMADTEVVFTAILSAKHFGCNFRKGLHHVVQVGYCRRALSESRFLKRLKAIPKDFMKLLLRHFAEHAGAINEYVIDSFPLSLCHNVRIWRSRLVQGTEYKGYNSSKQQFFYGIKVHAIISTTGVPILFETTPGSVHDLVAFKEMDMTGIEEGIIYADAAYTDYRLEDQLNTFGLKMVVDRKSNSKRPHSVEVARNLKTKRKAVETFFSALMRLFPRTIHAITLEGVILKLTLFFSAFAAFK